MNYYQSTPGSKGCIECANNQMTLQSGADDISDCISAGKLHFFKPFFSD